MEDADAGIGYYSHSGISLPAYNNTYCDKQDLDMGDSRGYSSNSCPCREDSNYAYLIILIISTCTIIQTYRIYGLTEDLNVGGNLRALNMTKNGLPLEVIVESNFQVNFYMATSDTTMAINYMSTTENGTLMPIKITGAAVRMGNVNEVMVPINDEMPMNDVFIPSNMQEQATQFE